MRKFELIVLLSTAVVLASILIAIDRIVGEILANDG